MSRFITEPEWHNLPAQPEWHKWRSFGFQPIWFRETVIGGGPVKPDAWECRRGCGTLVWDPGTHMEAVCRTWEPVVGNE